MGNSHSAELCQVARTQSAKYRQKASNAVSNARRSNARVDTVSPVLENKNWPLQSSRTLTPPKTSSRPSKVTLFSAKTGAIRTQSAAYTQKASSAVSNARCFIAREDTVSPVLGDKKWPIFPRSQQPAHIMRFVGTAFSMSFCQTGSVSAQPWNGSTRNTTIGKTTQPAVPRTRIKRRI